MKNKTENENINRQQAEGKCFPSEIAVDFLNLN